MFKPTFKTPTASSPPIENCSASGDTDSKLVELEEEDCRNGWLLRKLERHERSLSQQSSQSSQSSQECSAVAVSPDDQTDDQTSSPPTGNCGASGDIDSKNVEKEEEEEDCSPGWLLRKLESHERSFSRQSSQSSHSSQEFCSEPVSGSEARIEHRTSEGAEAKSEAGPRTEGAAAKAEAGNRTSKRAPGWLNRMSEDVISQSQETEQVLGQPSAKRHGTLTKRKSFVFPNSEVGPAISQESHFASGENLTSEPDTGLLSTKSDTGLLSSKPDSGFQAPARLVKVPLLNGCQKSNLPVKTTLFKEGEDITAKAKGKATKTKKEKDPSAPKRGKSSYLFYCTEARGGLREEQPGLSLTDVSKELGRRWQALAPAEKAKYEEMAEKDRGRYQGEKKKYEESRPQPPKRGKSAYIFFSNEMRAQVALDNPNMKLPDIGKELGSRWNSLEAVEKTKYEEMAVEDRKRFAMEKEKFVQSTPERKEEVKETNKKVPKQKEKAVKGIPKKPEAVELPTEESVNDESQAIADQSVLVEDLLNYVLENITEDSLKSYPVPPIQKFASNIQKSAHNVPAKESDVTVPSKKSVPTVPAKKSAHTVPSKKSVLVVPAKKSDLTVPAKSSEKKSVEKRPVGRPKKRAPTEESPIIVSKRRKRSNMSTKEALLRLQRLRVAGTWAMCTIKTCSKWRYLSEVKDPAEVPELFTCKDCPVDEYSRCEAEEQEWDSELDSYYVDTKYTVGSLVWAKMDGFPTWPAMVDDDPETGSFFWTEMKGGSWQQQPSSYHVIFFDEKAVSRAWLATSRLTKFDSCRPQIAGTALGSRLAAGFTTAVQAAGQTLQERRQRYCFAQLYQGTWGPVWPDFGQERDDLAEEEIEDMAEKGREDKAEETDDMTEMGREAEMSEDISKKGRDDLDFDVGDISSNMLSLGDSNMSFIDKSFNCDLLASLDQVCRTPAKAVEGKENEPPFQVLANLYNDKTVFTQELSQPQLPSLLSVSFTQHNEDEFSEELTKEVMQAVQATNNFTPIKRMGRDLGTTPGKLPLGTSYQTSTPVKASLSKEEVVEEETQADTSAPFDETFFGI